MRAAVTLDRPWLRMALPQEMRVLSWAPHGAGYTPADAILWREVRNADLTPEFDAEGWLAAQMPQGAVGMLTSRDVGTFHERFAEVEGVTAHCLATVGLSNGESVGRRGLRGKRARGRVEAHVIAGPAGGKQAERGKGGQGDGTMGHGTLRQWLVSGSGSGFARQPKGGGARAQYAKAVGTDHVLRERMRA